MATTQETLNQDSAEFQAAFSAPDQEHRKISEDEAFGLTPAQGETIPPEDGDADGGMNDNTSPIPEVSVVIESEHEDSPVNNETAEEAPQDEPMDPKDAQREKSWEGRLRAREAELKAREDALAAREGAMSNPTSDDPGEGQETPEQEAGEAEMTEALEQAAADVESGAKTPEEALATLSSDFGEEFGNMLKVIIQAEAKKIAEGVADERVGKVGQTVNDLLSDIQDDKARSHFEAIADAHPDFQEIAGGDLMKGYLERLPESERAKAESIIENGSARQIIKLLNDVKASKQAEPEQITHDAASVDAAEGVRSKGLRIPEKPVESQDYSAAWNEF